MIQQANSPAEQQQEGRLPPMVPGMESPHASASPAGGQPLLNAQQMQNQLQLRRGQFERKKTLGPSAIPNQFQIQQHTAQG